MQLLLDEAQATVDPLSLQGPRLTVKRHWETVQAEAACGSRAILSCLRGETEKVSPKAASLPEANPSHPAVICRYPDPALPCRARTAHT